MSVWLNLENILSEIKNSSHKNDVLITCKSQKSWSHKSWEYNTESTITFGNDGGQEYIKVDK